MKVPSDLKKHLIKNIYVLLEEYVCEKYIDPENENAETSDKFYGFMNGYLSALKDINFEDIGDIYKPVRDKLVNEYSDFDGIENIVDNIFVSLAGFYYDNRSEI